MTNRSVRWVVGFGVFAILGILSVQAYFFYNAFNIKERQTVQSIRISLQTVAERLASYNESTLPDNIIHQFSPEYFIVDINDQLDARVLEYYLRSELKRRQVSLDFEYAIYDCHNDQMVYGNYVDLDDEAGKRNILKNWPKYDDGIYYFGVHFPGMRNYIFGQMEVWYFFSGILFVVILFFGYSILIILQQKRLSEIQRDFINNMSHEFKTPLTSISLAADVLSEDGIEREPGRLKKYAGIIREQTIRMRDKVDKILLQSKTSHRLFSLNKSVLSLEEVVREIASEFRLRAEMLKGSIEVEVDGGEPFINADRFHLTGLLVNLVDNSMKYHGGAPEVKICIRESAGEYELSVKDNGTGIDRKHLRKIFDEFYRVPSGNVHNVKGSGLGLSYVRKISELHRWKLGVTSEPGSGTVVTLRIPKIKDNRA